MASTDVKNLLVNLHDHPVLSAQDLDLQKVYTYLISIPPDDCGKLHWFCNKADSTTRDAAAFLLRLFAYDSAPVTVWKERLNLCMKFCVACVQGLEKAKLTSRHSYFGAFDSKVLDDFYCKFEQWELESVWIELNDLGCNPSSTVADQPILLSTVAPAVLYRIIANWTIFSDPQIQSLIQNQAPSNSISGWPEDIPPPGLFLLLLNESSAVRQWAKRVVSNYTVVPIPEKSFEEKHINALMFVNKAMSFGPSSTLPHSITIGTTSFLLTSDLSELWSGFHSIMRLLPVSFFKSMPRQNSSLSSIVTSHLHDIGPHFIEILRCLHLLLKRMGSSFWVGEEPEFPLVVFDAIKDNSSLTDLLKDLHPLKDRPWYLAIFNEYLHTVGKLYIYRDVFNKLVDFLCGEMQHGRFHANARSVIMESAARIWSSAFRQCKKNDTLSATVLSSLAIHADTLIGVAYSHNLDDKSWSIARAEVRSLITDALESDTQHIISAVERLSYMLARQDRAGEINILPMQIQTEMWGKVFSSIQSSDVDGIATILCVISKTAHLDILKKQAFKVILKLPQLHSGSNSSSVEEAVDGINHSLNIIREGFLPAVRKFADCNLSSTALDVLRFSGAAKAMVLLLLSPIEEFQVAAQTIVGLAFDVDGRLECFRALFENLSQQALQGIFEFLSTFIKYASSMPEACSVSKSLVRCLTDVIEVLCSSPYGLLHNSRFLQSTDEKDPACQLPELWDKMTISLSVIFKRTPTWSKYFDNDEMIVWMRDALIFGREMLAQWRVFESAANSSRSRSSSKVSTALSKVGKKMMDALQQLLLELTRWLRLTDEELLHQSFALLESLIDLFKETHVAPSQAALDKLTKHVDEARKDPDKANSRLDSARVLRLENALASYTKDEDEVQIISHSYAPKHLVSGTKVTAKSMTSEPGKKAHSTQKIGIQPSVGSTSRRTSSSKESEKRLLNEAASVSVLRKPSKVQLDSSAASSADSKRSESGPKNEALSHTMSREDSASETDSEEEATQDGGLEALGKLMGSPKIKKVAPRRQIKTLDIPTHRNPIQERLNRRDEIRRAAMRLKPDVSDLHRAILSWKYDHADTEPPGKKTDYIQVPDKFNDYNHYRRIFEPLLLLECWAQIQQSKNEKQDYYPAKVISRQFSDAWLDVDLSIEESVRKDWYLADTDVVLLRHLENKRCILAKTQSYRTTPQGIQIVIRCFIHGEITDPGLHIDTTWKLSKVFSLSTLHREYGALVSMPYYDLCDSILQPSLAKSPEIDPKELRRAMIAYNVNKPQAAAILKSMKTEGFALIQGPPGTGKTSTICGLVAMFMSKRSRPSTIIRPGMPPEKGTPAKILVCAPSNAAIDEIAHRLKDGYSGSEKGTNTLKIVRLGMEQSMNISVRDISLDYLVDQKLDSNGQSQKSSGNDVIISLRTEIESLKQLRQHKIEEKSLLYDNGARVAVLETEIQQLSSKRMTLTQQLDRLKDKQRSDYRTLDALRRATRKEILKDADVICSTLSGAGHEILEDFDFEMVIIDEAAQAIELSSLIPLKYRCVRCVMVGDPQQLPPTVLSQEACKYRYNQSLFVRLQKHRPDAVHLLNIQYRMHPDISCLPSRVFYQGRLEDGPGMDIKTKQPWHTHDMFGTYKFFNISKGLEEQSASSIKNVAECQVAVALYNRLRQEFSSFDFDFRVGIVSMYRAQIVELRRQFELRFGQDISGRVDFNTVDGFQGQEKDIIILSCVRAGPGLQSIGFLSDIRRMNVALTRAKSSLFILGNSRTLERSDRNWSQIVDDARSRSSLIDADAAFFTRSVPTPSVAKATPRKTKSSSTATPLAMPQDLATPSELKAATERKSSLSRSKHVSETSGMMESVIPLQDAPAGAGANVSRGVKRLAESTEALGSETPNNQQRGVDKPAQQPPIKRAKKPSTIFIPSKPSDKKRKSST